LLVNLPLSLLTGLADGLALKDRATRHLGRDSPQQWVPRSPTFSVGRGLSGSAHGTLAKVHGLSTSTDSVVQRRTFVPKRIAQRARPPPRCSGDAISLVTGAARGLGLEIARRLVGRGYERAVTDVDAEATSAAAEELGDGAWSLALDVTDTQACRVAAAQVAERSGSLDVWVNNAGILITGISYEQEIEIHKRMLEVNALGTFNGTLAAVERMRDSGRGHIINVISLSGLAAAPGIVGYSASKHAAIAFSLGTGADLRRSGLPEIRVSTVCPDGVWTPMINDKLDDTDDALSFSGVMLMPEQVAERSSGCSTGRSRSRRSWHGADASSGSSTATRPRAAWRRC
jgi:NAD(P)-dependent dehydrogenase (short-subunit alcohol dehydrogenase family)